MSTKVILVASAALMLVSGATAAAAATNLVTNGSFEITSLTAKGKFLGKVDGWSGGDKLTFLDTPGTADSSTGGLAVYGPFPTTSARDGGNFVMMDGDPKYSDAISQTISNLTIGKAYTLTFEQAAGQQKTYKGPTTEQWKVSFGDQTQYSALFSLPEGAVGPWQTQTMTFTASATSQVLKFLAAGTPNGAPPISFLDGVSLIEGSAVPEPASWAMMVVGFGALGGVLRRRRPVRAIA